MFYSHLSIKGFGPYYNKKDIDFKDGINVITGDNGSGKSSIVDAIQWNLFGPRGSDRTLSDRTSVINLKSQSAHVTLVFYNEIGEKITSHRSLSRAGKHSLVVTVDDEEVPGGLSESQEILNDAIFNIDSQTFSAVSMMQSSPSIPTNKFITGSSVEKREILSVLVDPTGKWESTHKIVEKRLKEERALLRDYENKYSIAEGILENIDPVEKPSDNIEELRAKLSGYLSQRSTSDDSVNDRIRSFELELDNIDNSIDTLAKRIESAHKKIYEKENDIVSLSKKLQDAQSKVENDKNNSLDDEISSTKYLLKALSKQEEVLEAQRTYLHSHITREQTLSDLLSQSGNSCIVCGSQIDHDENHNDGHIVLNHHAEDVEYSQKFLDHLGKKRISIKNYSNFMREYTSALISKQDNTDWEEEATRYQSMIDDVNSTKYDLKADLNDYKKKKDVLEEKAEDLEDKISHLKNQIESDTTSEENIDEKVESLEKKIRSYEDSIDRYSKYVSLVKEKKSKLSEAEKNLDWQTRKVNAFLNLREQTSVKGVISEDIDNISHEISEYANQTYEYIFNSKRKIVVASKIVKDSPVSSITAEGRPLETFSHGEQNRMIMCILLGITLAMHDRYNVWVPPMWDEPTTVIDKKDESSVFNIMCMVMQEESRQCVIITREEEIIQKSQDKISNIIRL